MNRLSRGGSFACVLALGLLAACATGGRGLAGGGRAPPGYERFECFPVPFRFRPGTAEGVDDADIPAVQWYDLHRRYEWVVLTLYGRSPSGAPTRRVLLDRRAGVILDWLAGQGRRRDRVMVRVDPEAKSSLRDSRQDASAPKLEMGADLTLMLSHDEAEAVRKTGVIC